MDDNKTNLLQKAHLYLDEANLGHAYILESNDASIRQKVATEFAKHILCTLGGVSSIRFDSKNAADFIHVSDQKIALDTIRATTNMMFTKPLEGKFKVFWLEHADSMRNESQNALLKSLEEPPEYVIWILTTNNSSKLLPTIQSRSQLINLRLEHGKISSNIEPLNGFLEIIEGAITGNYYRIFTNKDFYENMKDRKEDLLFALNDYFSSFLFYKVTGNMKENTPNEYKQSFRNLNSVVNINQLNSSIAEIEKIRQLFDVNINFTMAIEHLFITIGKGRNND